MITKFTFILFFTFCLSVFASSKDELLNLNKKQEDYLTLRKDISLQNRKTFFLSKEILVEESLGIKKQEALTSLIFLKENEELPVKKPN